MFWTWFLIVIIFLLICLEIHRQYVTHKYRHIPGLKEYPVIGNALAIMTNKIDDLLGLLDMVNPYPVTKIHVGNLFGLFIAEPEAAQQVLGSSAFLDRPLMFDFFKMKSGLLTARYHTWRPIRRTVNRTLSTSSVRAMIPLFNKHIDRLCDTIGQQVGQGSFDLKEACLKFGLEQIFDTTLETDFNATSHDLLLVQEASDAVAERIINWKFYLEPIYRLSSLHKKLMDAHEHYRIIIEKIIRKKREEIIEEESDEKKFIQEKSNNQISFIEKLLTTEIYGRKFTDKEIDDNLKTIILTGFETSTNEIAFILLMLAMHPDVDQKLYDEIKANYNDAEDLDHETVKKMNYLDMVVKETLRLLPVVPVIGRQSTKDVYLDKLGHIEKGTLIGISYFKLHRNPDIYGPDADKFNPDNFLPEKVAKRHKCSFIPFSYGPRNCLGLHYANLNMRMAIIKLISKFRFTTKLKLDELTFKFGVAMTINQGCLVEVHPR